MKLSEKLFKEGNGILRLKPTWVPRAFCRPGKRIKLHPDDYYVLGLESAKYKKPSDLSEGFKHI